MPRMWIVGKALEYHEEPAYGAAGIYYGFEGRWWDPEGDRRP
ncbi:hypothetical protein [Actinoplanes philippinensis]|nr:hypothetical protein [Actinoplanes philippinensis]